MSEYLFLPTALRKGDKNPQQTFSYLPQTPLLVGLPESSGGIIITMALHSHITWGMKNRPVGGRYSET
jgi:hypothetical protein